MKVAIIGSRNCNISTKKIMSFIPTGCTTIISGGARGVDSLAAQTANALGYELIEFYPDYKKYGKRAPLLRNMQIIRSADRVLAFWDMQSSGTRFVIEQCIKLKIPVNVIPIT